MADEKNPRLRSSIGARPVEKEVGSGQGEITIVDAREIKHADDALRAFADYEGAGEVMDEATNRRLVRKIDRRIMPVRKCREGRISLREERSGKQERDEEIEDAKKSGREGRGP